MNHRARARYGLTSSHGSLRGLGGDTPEYTWQHSRAQALDKAVGPFIADLPGAEYVRNQSVQERVTVGWWVVDDFKRHNQSLPPTAKTREEAIAYLEQQEAINRQAATMPGAQSANDRGAADRSKRFADALRAQAAAEKQKAEDDADAKAVADAQARALAAETAKITTDVTWLKQQARAMEYLAYPAATAFFAQDAASNPGSGNLPKDITAAFSAHGQTPPPAAGPKDFDTAMVYAQTAIALYQRVISADSTKNLVANGKPLQRVNELRKYLNLMVVVKKDTSVIDSNLAVGDAALQREKDANIAADKARRGAEAAKASGDAKAVADAEARAKAAADEVKKAQADRRKSADELIAQQKELNAQLADERAKAQAEQQRLIDEGRDAASKATEQARADAAKAIADAQAKAEAEVATMRAAQAAAEAVAAKAAADLAKASAEFEGASQMAKDRAARAEADAVAAQAKADAAEKKANAANEKIAPPDTAPPPVVPTVVPQTRGAIPIWAVATGGVAVLGLVTFLLWPRKAVAP